MNSENIPVVAGRASCDKTTANQNAEYIRGSYSRNICQPFPILLENASVLDCQGDAAECDAFSSCWDEAAAKGNLKFYVSNVSQHSFQWYAGLSQKLFPLYVAFSRLSFLKSLKHILEKH